MRGRRSEDRSSPCHTVRRINTIDGFGGLTVVDEVHDSEPVHHPDGT